MLRDLDDLEQQEAVGFDWSEIDLARHQRVTEHAGPLLAKLRGSIWDLEQILRDFAQAAQGLGMRLEYRREPEALIWHLALVGPNFRAGGAVEITLETATTVAIVARPAGDDVLTFDVMNGAGEDFATHLRNDFRAAVASCVLDAATVITL